VIHRHVVQTQVLGQEIAVWRDDTGAVNAWENRCPHRGVRLSLGLNTGTELRCRYHGWRFASGSGQCTFIPAHPTQKPASAMRAGVFGAVERHAYVWVRLEPEADPNADADADAPISPLAQFAQLAPGSAMTLRSIFVEAPADAVAALLLRGYRLGAATDGTPAATTDAATVPAGAPTAAADAATPADAAPVIAEDAYTYVVTDGGATLRFLLQPVTESRTVIHAFLTPAAAPGERLAVLRHHNAQMSALRNEAERLRAGAARAP